MMSLFDIDLGPGQTWTRVGDCYSVTKKPRGLNVGLLAEIPFSAMDTIPQCGAYDTSFTMKSPQAISSGTYFERGDVLVAKITPSFENGKQALVRTLPAPFGYATTEVIPLHPSKPGHDPRLLFFYLLHPDVRHHVADRMEGSTGRQRVPEGVLLDLPIPEIDPDDQSAIADALETIQAAIKVELEGERNASALKQAAMRKLFSRGLHGEPLKDTDIGPVPDSWDVIPVSQLAIVKGGKRMPKGVPLVRENTGRPYIRVTDFKDHSVRDEGILFVPVGYEGIIERYRISSRDVYISIAGTIGLVGQVPKTLDDANLTENAAKLVFERDDVLPRHVMYALAGEVCQDQISRATAKNAQPKLALTRIENIRVPTPPSINEQREIVTILDAIDRKIDLHRQKRAVLEELFKSLLHKLMTGAIRVDELDLSALADIPGREEAAVA